MNLGPSVRGRRYQAVSQQVYAGDPVARQRLRALTEAAFRPLAAWHHYRAMAKRNAKEYLGGIEVRLKKYFYVLRPLLCSLWLEREPTLPPVEFAALVDALLPSGDVRQALERLRALKRESSELGSGPAIAALDAYVEQHLSLPPPLLPDEGLDPQALDAEFRALIGYRT